jgi:hypothetical protein
LKQKKLRKKRNKKKKKKSILGKKKTIKKHVKKKTKPKKKNKIKSKSKKKKKKTIGKFVFPVWLQRKKKTARIIFLNQNRNIPVSNPRKEILSKAAPFSRLQRYDTLSKFITKP